MIFSGHKRAPSRPSPGVAALQAGNGRGGGELHIPSSVRGKGIPPSARLGRFGGQAHSAMEAEKRVSRFRPPRRPPKSATLKIYCAISPTLGGISTSRKPNVSVSREKSSCPPRAPNAPFINKAGISAPKTKAVKPPLVPATPTAVSEAKRASSTPPPPNLNLCPGRVSWRAWETEFPRQRTMVRRPPKTHKVGCRPGFQSNYAAPSHANQLTSSFQRRREGLFTIATASLRVAESLHAHRGRISH